MIKYENECVDCGLPCVGNACHYIRVPHLYCDICGLEETLYYFDGDALCIDCIIKELKTVSIDDYKTD